jgi:hypothetical protein
VQPGDVFTSSERGSGARGEVVVTARLQARTTRGGLRPVKGAYAKGPQNGLPLCATTNRVNDPTQSARTAQRRTGLRYEDVDPVMLKVRTALAAEAPRWGTLGLFRAELQSVVIL